MSPVQDATGPGVPTWRRQPYRVFFALGLLLAWAGVLPWLLFASGNPAEYRPIYHSVTQIQGFLMCFAVGFLFTMIPRRTKGPPPSSWQMVLCLLAPIGTVVSAWLRVWPLAQLCWMVGVLVLLTFAVKRFTAAGPGHGPPNSFVWVPVALLCGLAGSGLIALYGVIGAPVIRLYPLGRLLLLQGMFLGFVLGIGGMLLPLITRGESPPASGNPAVRAWHLLGAAFLLVTFLVENGGRVALAEAMRAGLVLVVLLLQSRMHRLPTRPGWHRWLVWFAAWMIPLGYALAAAWPSARIAMLHVVFIGGFALMAFSVGLHVTLAHGGREDLVFGRPWQVPVFGGLLLLAVVFRGLESLGLAALTFLLGTLLWASLAAPLWLAPVKEQRGE